ncbi:MAG: NUDIX domain-containing protein, partial [Anaerolineae bacterium]|nr:NUDIX domain-containing protein [Anaerolineae bacterium]
MLVIPRVLCFITHGDDVLLLRGAPDKRFWANRYNGIGGHLEPGEDIYSAARREIQEEAGIPITELRLRGVISVAPEGDEPGVLLFVFT